MIRRLGTVLFAVCFVLSLGQAVAAASDHEAKCDVTKECTKSEDGMTCTITAKDETRVDAVRERVRKHAGDHAMEGVEVTFEDVAGGIRVVMTASTDEALKALRTHHEGCCAKAGTTCDHGTKAAPHHGCEHAKAAAGAHGCDHGETAAPQGGCDHSEAAPGAHDCDHATAAAGAHDCAHAGAADSSHHGCSHHDKS